MSEFVMWAERFEEMTHFYAELLQTELEPISIDAIKLSDGIHTIHLHRIPSEYLEGLPSVAEVRHEAPMKPVFVLQQEKIAGVLQKAVVIKTFTFEDAEHVDIADPDGNVICIRQKETR